MVRIDICLVVISLVARTLAVQARGPVLDTYKLLVLTSLHTCGGRAINGNIIFLSYTGSHVYFTGWHARRNQTSFEDHILLRAFSMSKIYKFL